MIERAIPQEQVPTDPISCPTCKNQNITLKGNICRAFSERLRNGEVLEQELAEELERETSVIECHDCNIRFIVMTEEEYELSIQNMQLHEALMQFSPEFVRAGNKLPC